MSGLPPPYRRTHQRDELMDDTDPLERDHHELGEEVRRLRERVKELDNEAQRLGETLYDLKTHVENADRDAFDYPDTVGAIVDHADSLLDGRSGKDLRSRAELKDENEQLEEALSVVVSEAQTMHDLIRHLIYAPPSDPEIVQERARDILNRCGGGATETPLHALLDAHGLDAPNDTDSDDS